MLEIITAQIPGQCQIFFNISANVGMNSVNDKTDVELVQLGYYCSAINSLSPYSSEVKALFKLVIPGASYSGSPTDPLTRAIEADERFRGIKPDGHISRMRGGIRYNNGRGGKDSFLLTHLCNNIFDVMSDVYPRIDLDGRCPGNLASCVKKLLRN